MNNKIPDIDIAKDARKGYGPLLKKSAPFLGLFFMIMLLVWLIDFVLSYVGSGTIFLTVLIIGSIVLPFYFSVLVCSFLEEEGRTIGAKDYFRTAGLYFSPSFFGSFRILRNVLISLAVSLGTYFLFSVFYVTFSRFFDPNLTEEVDKLYTLLASGDAAAANKFLLDSVSLSTFSKLGAFAMDAGFILPLIYLLGRTSFLVFMRDAMLTPDSRIVNSAYKEALRGKGRGYNKDFFKATWWVYVLLLVFYVGGVVTGYFLLKDNPYIGILMNLVGVGFMMIPLAVTIPYYRLVMTLLFKKYKRVFVEASLDLARRAFEELKYANQIGEEDAKKYEEALKQAEESLMWDNTDDLSVYDAEATVKDHEEDNKEE